MPVDCCFGQRGFGRTTDRADWSRSPRNCAPWRRLQFSSQRTVEAPDDVWRSLVAQKCSLARSGVGRWQGRTVRPTLGAKQSFRILPAELDSGQLAPSRWQIRVIRLSTRSVISSCDARLHLRYGAVGPIGNVREPNQSTEIFCWYFCWSALLLLHAQAIENKVRFSLLGFRLWAPSLHGPFWTHRLRFIPETWVTLLARRGFGVVRACMSHRRNIPDHSP